MQEGGTKDPWDAQAADAHEGPPAEGGAEGAEVPPRKDAELADADEPRVGSDAAAAGGGAKGSGAAAWAEGSEVAAPVAEDTDTTAERSQAWSGSDKAWDEKDWAPRSKWKDGWQGAAGWKRSWDEQPAWGKEDAADGERQPEWKKPKVWQPRAPAAAARPQRGRTPQPSTGSWRAPAPAPAPVTGPDQGARVEPSVARQPPTASPRLVPGRRALPRPAGGPRASPTALPSLAEGPGDSDVAGLAPGGDGQEGPQGDEAFEDAPRAAAAQGRPSRISADGHGEAAPLEGDAFSDALHSGSLGKGAAGLDFDAQTPCGVSPEAAPHELPTSEPPQRDDPLVLCLPLELRKEVPAVKDPELVTAHCFAMRPATWPELLQVGGGGGGLPNISALRALSERLLCRLEEQTMDKTKPLPPGSDQTAVFAAGNKLDKASEEIVRSLPDTARLRVIRAGPVVGHDREAVVMARIRRAMEGVSGAGEVPDLQTFVANNWIGTATERVLRAATPELQRKVMQKGPLLGPCPQKELLDRLDRLEPKLTKEAGDEGASLQQPQDLGLGSQQAGRLAAMWEGAAEPPVGFSQPEGYMHLAGAAA